jgi:ATP-dependent protease ClpP protease subunit
MKKKTGIKLTKSRVEIFSDCDFDIETRTIWLGSALLDDGTELHTDAGMAERATKALFLLDSVSSAPITILMNNAGGDEIHGLAIADAITLVKSKVTIKVLGHAMSMGSIILQAADERLLAPNASVMIHYGSPMVADPDLHALEQQMWSRECEKFRANMELLYLAKMREKWPELKLSAVKKFLSFGTIFSADDAVKWGLADAVLIPKRPFPFGQTDWD